MNNLDLCLEVV